MDDYCGQDPDLEDPCFCSIMVLDHLCRSFHAEGHLPPVWPMVLAGADATQNVFDDWLSNVGERFSEVSVIRVGNLRGRVTDCGVEKLVRHCYNLRELDLSGAMGRIADKALQAIGERCAALEFLNVEGSSHRITDTGVQALSVSCRMLRVLDLSGSGLRGACFATLCVACPRIEELNLSNCKDINPNPALRDICANLKHLRRLSVEDCQIQDDILLHSLAASATSSLHFLDITGNDCFRSEDAWRSLLRRHFGTLRTLRLGRCQTKEWITNALQILSESDCELQEFECVSASDVSRDVFLTLASSSCLRHLRHINMSFDISVDDAVVVALVRNAPNLTSVNLSFTSIGNEAITAMQSLALRALFLTCCKRVTASALAAALVDGWSHTLEEVSIGYVDSVDELVAAALWQCAGLKKIAAQGSPIRSLLVKIQIQRPGIHMVF